VVLGRRPDHGGAANVDVLDAVGKRCACRDSGLEGIEVHHQQVDGRDAVRRGCVLVPGVAADGEQPAVHPWVERLEPPVHHLGKAGVLGHILDSKAGAPQGLGRAAGGKDLHPPPAQRRGEPHHPGLVGDRDQRAPDRYVGHGKPASPACPQHLAESAR
jgi:hypothetical protein